MTAKQKLRIKPINAYAIVKESQAKNSHGNYQKVYKLSAYDIFADNHVEVGYDEKLIRVRIEAINI